MHGGKDIYKVSKVHLGTDTSNEESEFESDSHYEPSLNGLQEHVLSIIV